MSEAVCINPNAASELTKLNFQFLFVSEHMLKFGQVYTFAVNL